MTQSLTGTGAAHNARPYLHGPEQDALCEALASGQWAHGPVTERFEQELATFLGVPDVVAVASGTTALHLGLLAAGIGEGDEVVVPSFTFCASIQAIRATGAHPRFIDVDPATLCVTAQQVADALTPRTRAVMPVLFGGRAVDLTVLRGALDERGIAVVEDAAHAFGSYQGLRRVGATGDATCFSFDPIKNLTCGEGGALVPCTKAEAQAVRRLRTLGITRPESARTDPSYQVESFGLRAHLPSLHAAIGRVQLRHFATVENARRSLWRAYRTELSGLDGVVLVDVDVDHAVPFNCVARILDGPERRDRLFRTLREAGIGVGVHYPPNHLQPAFAPWRCPLPATEQVAGQVLSLPFHPALTEEDIHRTASALRHALRTCPT